jgi:hypothetical protein
MEIHITPWKINHHLKYHLTSCTLHSIGPCSVNVDLLLLQPNYNVVPLCVQEADTVMGTI